MIGQEVARARKLLESHFPPTRLVPAPALSRRCGTDVWLKLEGEGPTGSFKPQGVFTALRRQTGRVPGVVTSSTGNHGAAVAYACRQLNLPATVFLPRHSNPLKRRKILELGATVIEAGADLAEAFDLAQDYAVRSNLYFLADGIDPDLLPGAATVGAEILEQCPAVGHLYMPVGDSTLIRGVALAARHRKPGIRITGVQAEQAPAYALSWKQGKVVCTDSCETIADGLATRRPVAENVRLLRDLVDEMVLVSEEGMLEAIGLLLLEEHVVAEPAAAAPLAACLKRSGPPTGPAVLIVSGSNVSAEVLKASLERGGSSSDPPAPRN